MSYVIGVLQTVAVAFAPFVGLLLDRVNRLMALFIVTLIASIGCLSIYFVADPQGPIILVSAVLIGAGQIGVIVGSQVLYDKLRIQLLCGGLS